jgi:hypothetical protein
MAAQDEDEDSDKMEEDEWESQQIRKGVTGAQVNILPSWWVCQTVAKRGSFHSEG